LSSNNIGAAGYVLCFYLYGTGIIIKREILFPHFGCWYASRKGRAAYATAACCFLEATNRGKKIVLAAFVYYGDKEKPEIIIGTDTQMDALTLCKYYGLRFQVEFLIRDAKQYAGLEDCQARDQQKLHTHFNVALTAVSIAKAACYLSVPIEQRGSFSMADIKMLHMNQLITKRIFSNLAVDLSCRKIKRIYNHCLNFGRVYPDRSGLRA
jgi:hypothetical protein